MQSRMLQVARLLTDHGKVEVLVQQLVNLEAWRLEILPLILTRDTIQVSVLDTAQ